MKNYEHITKMEDIMNSHEKALGELEKILNYIESHQEDYEALLKYYYSAQRRQDLEDDENGLIPQTLCRGVLSEDAIFDLIGDYQGCAIRMMEDALKIFKAVEGITYEDIQ